MPNEPDQAALERQAALIGGYATGALTAAMLSIGVRLGLYRAMADGEPVGSEELAARTGYHERWLREWLQQQAAARVLTHVNGAYALPPESAAFLANPESLRSMEALIASLPDRIALVPRVEEAFRTGVGFSVDDRGEAAAHGIDGLFANWHRQELVPTALPRFPGVVDKLRAGALVADVGCGSGLAVAAMATAFPASRFHGYDISRRMLELADRRRREDRLANATFHDLAHDPLPDDGRFDLVLTFDCLHDMTNPHETAAAIRRALRPDGAWVIADIVSAPSLEENLASPRAAGAYAMSILACLASALSEPGGAGYGTWGLPEPRMREVVLGAGFGHFRPVDVPAEGTAFYEAKP